jgi:hypothetical protein
MRRLDAPTRSAISCASFGFTPIARRIPATTPGACERTNRPSAAACIACRTIPMANSKASSGVTSPSRPLAAARARSSIRRPCALSATFGMDRAPRATSAPQAGLLSASPTNAPQPAAIRSTGSSVASRRGCNSSSNSCASWSATGRHDDAGGKTGDAACDRKARSFDPRCPGPVARRRVARQRPPSVEVGARERPRQFKRLNLDRFAIA